MGSSPARRIERNPEVRVTALVAATVGMEETGAKDDLAFPAPAFAVLVGLFLPSLGHADYVGSVIQGKLEGTHGVLLLGPSPERHDASGRCRTRDRTFLALSSDQARDGGPMPVAVDRGLPRVLEVITVVGKEGLPSQARPARSGWRKLTPVSTTATTTPSPVTPKSFQSRGAPI